MHVAKCRSLPAFLFCFAPGCGKPSVHQRCVPAVVLSGTEESFRGTLPPLDEVFSTLVSLLQVHTKSKSLLSGRCVHDHIIRCSLEKNILLGNSLIQFYGLCGCIHDSQRVFDTLSKPNRYSWSILLKAYCDNHFFEEAWSFFREMPHKDVVAWNTMMVNCTRSVNTRKAIDLFCQMQQNGARASNITFTCVLDACAKLGDLEFGHLIHFAIFTWHSVVDVAVGNALITMYGRCKNPVDARMSFMQMSQRDVISWSALIAAFVLNEQDGHALEIFYLMFSEGTQPSNITYVSVLDACANLGMLSEGKKILSCIFESGADQHEMALENAIVNLFGKCGSVFDAKKMFLMMHDQNVITWSALIGGYTRSGFCEEALTLFKQMYATIRPDVIAFVCALDACTGLSTVEEGKLIHAAIIENGLELTLVLSNSLINMYTKCGSFDHARNVFIQASKRDVVSWSTMITACTENEHGEEAFQFFCLMQLSGIKPNSVTFVCVLEACAGMAALVQGQLVHFATLEISLECDATVGTSLVNFYGKCGSFWNAKGAFDAILHQNVISWTSMLGVCVNTQHHREALTLFHKMQSDGVKANNATFVCALNSCSQLAALEEGKGVHAMVDDSECQGDALVMNALLNFYGRCGDVPTVVELFSKMPQQDVVSWNALILACAINGRDERAMDFFFKMQCQNTEPDSITAVSFLTACSYAGKVDVGMHFFASFSVDFGLIYTAEHYACIVDLMGRAGLLEVAEQLLKAVPFEEVHSAWASFLGACRIHNDFERGLHVAKHVFETYPDNATAYVDLSNVYAAAVGWE